MGRSFLRAGTNEGQSALLFQLLSAPLRPGQFVRELTQNAIEAIIERGGEGRVEWRAETERYEAPKLQIIDDGTGFDPDRMDAILLELLTEQKQLGRRGNYGIGGRISTLKESPAGVVYETWRAGQGYRCVLRWPGREGAPFLEDGRTWEIEERHPWGAASGTRVTLVGDDEHDDTTSTPKANVGLPGAGMQWILHTLNRRFCTFPDGIEVVVADPTVNHRSAQGCSEILSRIALNYGVVCLGCGTRIHWFLLPKDMNVVGPQDRIPAHVGLRWRSELYDSFFAGAQVPYRLGLFGVVLGTKRVAIHAEPKGDEWHPDAQRSGLVSDIGIDVPWERWGAEFGEKTPKAIQELEDQIRDQATSFDGAELFRELKRLGLLHFNRYYGSDGDVLVGEVSVPLSGVEHPGGGAPGTDPAGTKPESSLLSDGAKPRTPKPPSGPPAVDWLDDADTDGQLARFARTENRIVAWALHPLMRRLIDTLQQEAPKYASLAPNAAKAIMSTQILDYCLSIEGLAETGWDRKRIEDAWAPHGFTASAAAQYTLVKVGTRMLTTKRERDKLVARNETA